jgi:hypothetical protein
VVMFFNSILCCKSKVPWQSGTISHLNRIQIAVERSQGIKSYTKSGIICKTATCAT